MNIASLDLNLLVALDALLQERSVTRAAERMGLSQPALSASLARLRRHFGDDLLTRVGKEYRLTPLAVQLRDLTRVALGGAERVFTAQPEFDPAASRREFTVHASDYGVVVLGHEVARILAAEAPGTRLRLAANTPAVVDHAEQSLLSSDLIILPHGFLTDLSHADLCRDDWVCLVADDNAAVDETLTVANLQKLPWVVTYHGPTASTPAARQLRQSGIEPQVQVVTESFLTLPALVAGTDRIALVQRRLAALVPADAGLRVLPCPVDVGPLVEAMWWHPVFDDDPAHQYLRGVLERAAQALVDVGIDGADGEPRKK